VCFVLTCLPADVPYSESLNVVYFLSMAHVFTVPMMYSGLRAKPVNQTTGKPPSDGKTTGKPPSDGKTTGKPAAGTSPGQSGGSAGKAGNPADICVW